MSRVLLRSTPVLANVVTPRRLPKIRPPKRPHGRVRSSPYFQQGEWISPLKQESVKWSSPLQYMLNRPTLLVQRELELANVLFGFEQANRYKVLDDQGQIIAYMVEEDLTLTKLILRQIYRLHRPFKVRVYDVHGAEIMVIQRSFALVNSHIQVFSWPANSSREPTLVGESQQRWHLWRRRYDLFQRDGHTADLTQFAEIDAPVLAFQFQVRNESDDVIAQIDRNWVGLARELLTDTGVYALNMDPRLLDGSSHVGGPPSLEQRAVLLATVVSIDFDYFSRHSRPHSTDFGSE